ncbi:MAG: RNA polymerase sigma factor [Sphingomonadales bacterium]|nr:RNA polymerase sigma factor [Sphingomonadales bacterium]
MAATHPIPAPDEAPDDALMRRVAARDGAAFRALVARHAALPHRIAWRMLGEAAEAEDVAQDALLRLWQHAPRWRGDGPGVAAWLTRVATNLCLDRLRRRRPLPVEDVPERVDDAPLADAVLEAGEDLARVRRALDCLSERQRAAIVLTHYEELPNAEAALVLDMNIKAFESLLLRARRSLRSLLLEDVDA